MELIYKIGAVAGFLLPFFNIPLILRMINRKSSDDISLTWVIGVWICILLMTPCALASSDQAFRWYGVSNVVFFTLVVVFAFKYRFSKKS
ncbi:MAG: hypothetical protein HY585_04170 [Candidatus Omnitrophica bacterium]|nr:hypothetical protein [Candidatus Omnitrophota bacterium]